MKLLIIIYLEIILVKKLIITINFFKIILFNNHKVFIFKTKLYKNNISIFYKIF